MARYIGPKSKIARRFGEPIFGADKVLSKRNFPPGQHGNNRRRKMSEYGVMLAEKQKAKYTYGVLERQFRNMFDKGAKRPGVAILTCCCSAAVNTFLAGIKLLSENTMSPATANSRNPFFILFIIYFFFPIFKIFYKLLTIN